jgi:hypothetical protein
MTRKQFVKLLMAKKIQRNTANSCADSCLRYNVSYQTGYDNWMTLYSTATGIKDTNTAVLFVIMLWCMICNENTAKYYLGLDSARIPVETVAQQYCNGEMQFL